MKKSMVIDGVFASESLDTSGEILHIKGCDISDLQNGTGVLNFEHQADNPADVLGKIIYAKKIYGEKDCDDERQLAYWNKVGLPLIYGKVELFDGEGHPGAIATAAIIRYYHRRGESLLARFSIEGTTMDRDGNELKRSLARRVALTLKPCNRACYSGVIFDDMDKSEKHLYKGEYYESDILLVDDEIEITDSELEDIEKAFTRKPEPTFLDHYSDKSDLTEIHPKFHGTGVPGKESGGTKADRTNVDPGQKPYVNRSFYYDAGTKPEPMLAGKNKYSVQLPHDAKIYDLHDDPEDFVSQAMQALPYSIYNKEHRTWIENKIKEKGYFGYRHSGSHTPNSLAVFHPLKTIQNKKSELEKATTLGSYGGAPSGLVGGSALQTEQWADGKDRRKLKDPKEINKARAQVLSAFRDWDRITPIRKFLKNRLPDASNNYIERFAGIVDDYQVKKSEELFGNLGKAFTIGRSISMFGRLKKQQEIGSVESYLFKVDNDIVQLDLIGNRIKVAGGDYMPDEKVDGFFDLIKSGEASLKKKDRGWFVVVGLHDTEELTTHHQQTFYTFLDSIQRSLEHFALKHRGEILDYSNNQFKYKFDSEERAKAFSKDIQEIAATIEQANHSHQPIFNVGIGTDEESAKEQMGRSVGEREEGDGHAVSQEGIQLEKAYRYDPSIPDFDIATLKNVYKNHVQAVGYHKAREKDHSELPPLSTDQRKQRSLRMVDKAKASVDDTRKVLRRNLGNFTKDPGEQKKLVDQLHQEFLKEHGIDKTEIEPKGAGEYGMKNLKDLEHHLSNEHFAMISPASDSRGPEENEAHRTSFLEDLKTGQHSYTTLKGKFGGKWEPSYMVHNISHEDATALAQKYGQLSHISSEKGTHKYHVHKEHGYNPSGGTGHEIDGDFDDMFSEVDFTDGGKTRFRVNLEPPTKKSEVATFDAFSFLER